MVYLIALSLLPVSTILAGAVIAAIFPRIFLTTTVLRSGKVVLPSVAGALSTLAAIYVLLVLIDPWRMGHSAYMPIMRNFAAIWLAVYAFFAIRRHGNYLIETRDADAGKGP